MGARTRSLRRARGYVPAAIQLPSGFERAPPLLSYGGDLKATFGLLAGGEAVLSQHQGDLENRATLADYQKNLALYAALFDHRPEAVVADRHPDYASGRLARARARDDSLPLIEVQHHHAHAASCLAENGRELDAPPVLAVVLDGLGVGDGGALWGGEFLLADYRGSDRIGTFEPVALIGGDQAAREPWRNLYAHLVAGMGWAELAANFSDLELYRRLAVKPRANLDRMLEIGLNVPRASSCGRLFDAVAAAVGVTFERQAYEGSLKWPWSFAGTANARASIQLRFRVVAFRTGCSWRRRSGDCSKRASSCCRTEPCRRTMAASRSAKRQSARPVSSPRNETASAEIAGVGYAADRSSGSRPPKKNPP
jgi:hydrogenase maturation protein HypF